MVEKKSTKRKTPIKLTANQKEHLFALSSLLVQSTLVSRSELMARMGYSYEGDRDVYTALGYKKSLDFKDYEVKYKRQDIAKRVIDLPVKATWRKKPVIKEDEDPEETTFEKAWNDLVKDKRVFHYLQRIDKLASLGRYGCLLIGYDDGEELESPVKKSSDIVYLRPFKESNASIKTWEKDSKNPRYGLPDTYTLTFSNIQIEGTYSKVAHHSRVIHVAEGLEEDNVYGTPRLEVIYNRLLNMELISGGSAEMFWRGAFPGMGFGIDKEVDAKTLDLDDIKEQIEEYMHGFKRYLRLQGIDVKQFKPQVADPSSHVSVQLDLISAASEIPKRILIGSERGELASSQDEKNWNDTIDERRKNHAEPTILRQFIDNNISVGVLPEPKDGYIVEWPDLQIPSEKEEAEVGKTKAETINKYLSTPGATELIPPEIFLQKIMNFEKKEIEKINEILDGLIKEEEEREE